MSGFHELSVSSKVSRPSREADRHIARVWVPARSHAEVVSDANENLRLYSMLGEVELATMQLINGRQPYA